MNSNTYFKVKNFAIHNVDTHNDVEIDKLLYDFICSQHYFLSSDMDVHYDPKNFFDFLKFFSLQHPNNKFHVYYRYEYFNHDHINLYMNKMSVYKGEIQDRLNG